MHTAYMSKDAAVTVRISSALRDKVAARARRDRRSLSAQIVSYLERSVEEQESAPRSSRARERLLGLFAGTPIPSDADFAEVRRKLWGSLGGRRRRGRRAA
jgi:hypothetical protein